MKRLLALGLIGVAGLSASAAWASQDRADQVQAADGPEQAYHVITSFQPALSSEVRGLTIAREAATLVLTSGWIDVMAPVRDRYHTAVFRGEGRFTFVPPTPIERAQLEKFTGKDTLDEPFTSVVLRFTDDTVEEISASLRLEPTLRDTGEEGARLARESRERILKNYLVNVDARVLCDLHSGRRGYFLAEVSSKNRGDFIFEIDPQKREEVSLVKYEKSHGGFADTWCAFDLKAQYEGGKPVGDRPVDLIEIPHFEVDLTMEKDGDIEARAVIDVVALEDDVRAFPLSLSQVVEVDEIVDDKDSPCFFVHEVARDKVGEPPIRQERLQVFLPTAMAKGEKRKLAVRYHSDKLISKLPDYKEYVIRDTVHWYPICGYLQRATSRCTYRVPKGLQLIAVGTREKEWEEDGLECSTWVQDVPVALTCFNVGDFKHKRMTVEGLPPADVYMGKRQWGILVGGDAKQNAAADILNSLNYFQTLFGPYPFPGIVASEIPGGHGQGFPGFLHLAWVSFQDVMLQGAEEAFRGHEVSHQWWGHVVGWETYHDQWLSEGFAEYSGALFAQMTEQKRDPAVFEKMVENWKNDILHGGNMSFERYGMPKLPPSLTMGSESGPIWLGYRLSSSKSPIDYQILVYEKGAYVLHMLRMMMQDFTSPEPDKTFLAMMKDYIATYTWKNATTEGFRRIAEKHMNMDLGWFFDQWVYGTGIPTYRFRRRIEQGEDGKTQLVCDVEQSGVPDGFKMPVPLKIDFGKGRVAVIRLPVTKAKETFRMNVPAEPKDVVFNYNDAVLCSVAP